MLRLFVAVDLPQDVKDQIVALRHEDDLPAGRWVQPQQLHLTLRFIGQKDQAQTAAIQQALAAVKVPAFEMRLAGLGHFPPQGRPRVLWVGIENRPPLRDLHEGVQRALAQAGIKPDEQTFIPHITLARFKVKPRWGVLSRYLRNHADFYTEPFPVTQFVLYSSALSAQGSIYTAQQIVALSGNG